MIYFIYYEKWNCVWMEPSCVHGQYIPIVFCPLKSLAHCTTLLPSVYFCGYSKVPLNSSADEWITKMWHIHTTEYYLSIKSNEAMIHATTWINFENIMQSERSQSQKIT